MSNTNRNPDHHWKVLSNNGQSKVEAIEAGYGAIVKNTTYAIYGVEGNMPTVSESMVYVPNVKIRQVKDGQIGTENEKEIWILEPHFPGKQQ